MSRIKNPQKNINLLQRLEQDHSSLHLLESLRQVHNANSCRAPQCRRRSVSDILPLVPTEHACSPCGCVLVICCGIGKNMCVPKLFDALRVSYSSLLNRRCSSDVDALSQRQKSTKNRHHEWSNPDAPHWRANAKRAGPTSHNTCEGARGGTREQVRTPKLPSLFV